MNKQFFFHLHSKGATTNTPPLKGLVSPTERLVSPLKDLCPLLKTCVTPKIYWFLISYSLIHLHIKSKKKYKTNIKKDRGDTSDTSDTSFKNF